jgi:hypothetical protein
MKSLALLAAVTVLSTSGAAAALQEGAPRAVAVSGGRAGTAVFAYLRDYDGPTGSCAYTMYWQSPFAVPRPAQCVVRELKMIGQTSCLVNRLADVVTSVSSVPGCLGFDQYGLVDHVTLVLGEGATAPALTGLAIFETFPFLPQAISIE